MSNPNEAIREYDKKFDAWWLVVQSILGGDPSIKDCADHDPHGSFDSGMMHKEFARGVIKARTRTDKKLVKAEDAPEGFILCSYCDGSKYSNKDPQNKLICRCVKLGKHPGYMVKLSGWK